MENILIKYDRMLKTQNWKSKRREKEAERASQNESVGTIRQDRILPHQYYPFEAPLRVSYQSVIEKRKKLIRKSTIDVPQGKIQISRPSKMSRKLTIFDSPLFHQTKTNDMTPKPSNKELLSAIAECADPELLSIGAK